MISVNIRDAKAKLSYLLRQVEQGEEVQIERRGKPVAKISAVTSGCGQIPSLEAFRKSLKVTGPTLSEELIRQRNEARY